MRAHWFGASGSIVALLVGLSGVQAQDATGGTVGVNVVPAQPAVAPASVEVGPVQKQAALTPAEQLAQADAIAKRADQLAVRLSKMLDESRRDKDIMRANCVNRKLTEVNANARSIDQRVTALKDANAVNDSARTSHEYTVLTVLGQKLNSLDQEATQCLGQSVYEPGASQTITTISPGSPTLNPSTYDPSTVFPGTVTIPPPLPRSGTS